MKTNNEMIMPKDAMALNEDEMRSVEGGKSISTLKKLLDWALKSAAWSEVERISKLLVQAGYKNPTRTKRYSKPRR